MTTPTRPRNDTARLTPGASARQAQRVADPDVDLTTVQVDPTLAGPDNELVSAQAGTGRISWTSHMNPLPAHTACYAEDLAVKPAPEGYVSFDVEALPDVPAYADRPERESLGERADRVFAALIFIVGLVVVSLFPGSVLAAELRSVWPHSHWAVVALAVLAPAIPFMWWGIRYIKHHEK